MTTSFRAGDQIYEREIIVICHRPDRSSNHKHYDSGDIMFLSCHVTSHDNMFKGFYEFIGRRPSR